MDEKTQEQDTRITPRLIEEEMKQSYLNYSMSVIIGRALPDVRDGLKPVHRRILYAMFEEGLLHNKKYSKCAGVVGQVLKLYHPHGDTAVYDALVRLAQPWSMRYVLVDGHGNFGSIDGDPAAAYRYTECRLQKFSEEMLQDIDKKTVKFTPNFDNSTKEPCVLPSKVPNLLINGSSGIAVGMATNIPPHNMAEVVGAVVKQIDNPEIDIKEIIEHVKGPDFPTGAIIYGRDGILNAYTRGRGKIIVRAKTSVEEVKGKERIIVSEIPYMVNKSELIEEIANNIRRKRIEGISDLRDESDRKGMRIVIELRRDADKEIILNQLFRHTRLQTTFGIIMLALVDNVPKVLNLKSMIHFFVEHRKDVVRKKTLFELNKAQSSAHILEGIIIALENIDDIIKLVRTSKSAQAAKELLVSGFQLTQDQSQAILEMRLQRLTFLEQEKVRNEHKDLLKKIDELKFILSNPKKILDIIKSELTQLKQSYSDERRTEIIDEDVVDMTEEDYIKDEAMAVTITHSGYIKRLPLDTYKAQHRGGRGIIATTTKDEDVVKDIFVSRTHDYVLFFSNRGKVYWLKTHQIPEYSRATKGKPIINLVKIDQNERITAFIPVRNFDDSHYLVMATKKGTIKRTNLNLFSNPRKTGILAITLDTDDELIDVGLTDGTKEVIIATRLGLAVRFEEEKIRATGRSSQGVRGAALRNDDAVVSMLAANKGDSILSVTGNGFGKRTSIEEYRLTNRGSIGVINIKTSERNGNVVGVCPIGDNDEAIIITQNGIVIRVPATEISSIGRNTQGIRLIKLEEGDKVVSATVIKNAAVNL